MRVAAAILALIASSASLTLGAAPVAAEEPTRTTIDARGLDLSVPADRSRFEGRVRVATREVCGTAPTLRIRDIAMVQECRAGVWSQAWAQVRGGEHAGHNRHAR